MNIEDGRYNGYVDPGLKSDVDLPIAGAYFCDTGMGTGQLPCHIQCGRVCCKPYINPETQSVPRP